MSRSHVIAAVCTAALLGAGACGDPTSAASSKAAMPAVAPGSASDVEANIRQAQNFVNAAGEASLAEIDSSKLALAHATNPDVKTFAQMMIDDHAKALEALKAAAAAAALAPPSDTLDASHLRQINALTEDKSGEDFDGDYMRMQVEAHADALMLFQDYAKNGETPQVQSFAEATLPTLNMHSGKAESVARTANRVKPS